MRGPTALAQPQILAASWPGPPGAGATGPTAGLSTPSSRLAVGDWASCSHFALFFVFWSLLPPPHTHARSSPFSLRRPGLISLSNGPSFLHWAEGWPGPPKCGCGMRVAKGWGFTLGQPARLRTPPGKWPKTRGWSQGRAHLSTPAGVMCWAEACSRWRGGFCPLEPRSASESGMMTWKRETGDSDLEKQPGLGGLECSNANKAAPGRRGETEVHRC